MRKQVSVRLLGLFFTLVIGALLPSAAQAQSAASKGGATSTCNYNVTSILNNADSGNVALQFQSDGLGTYTAYRNGAKDQVTSVIGGQCQWSLDTVYSKSRGISVTLAYPESSPSQAPPFTGPQVVKGRINTHCSTNSANNGVDVGTMTSVGQTLICPINVAFYAPNGTWYNIGINPFNWTGTTMAQVTCTGASGSQCNSWSIVPDPATSAVNPATNQLSSIGELILPSCFGCDGGTALGAYYFAYSFLLHK